MHGVARTRVVVCAVLVAALILSGSSYRGSPWAPLLTFGFGLLNVLIAVPGTEIPRGLVVIGAIGAMLSWSPFAQWSLIVLAAVWTPLLFIAQGMIRDGAANRHGPADAASDEPLPNEAADPANARWFRSRPAVAAIVGACAVGSLLFDGLVRTHLYQTAALFVGLPTVIALAVIFLTSPETATGAICKGTTIALCVSVVFLHEGFLCIAMAAPLFYGAGVLLGAAFDARRRSGRGRPGGTVLSCVALLLLVPISVEGVFPATTINRSESVTVTRVLATPATAVADAVMRPPRFDRALPFYLRLGFPRPSATRIAQIDGRPAWVITMRGGETRLNGTEARAGDLVLSLRKVGERSVEWQALSDDSHMTHFLRWQTSRVEWIDLDATHTQVTWTLAYDRALDPAWYFGPWERYATRLAAGYLIDTVARP
jgi:hypothetical protein